MCKIWGSAFLLISVLTRHMKSHTLVKCVDIHNTTDNCHLQLKFVSLSFQTAHFQKHMHKYPGEKAVFVK